jgi:hypothetical protein
VGSYPLKHQHPESEVLTPILATFEDKPLVIHRDTGFVEVGGKGTIGFKLSRKSAKRIKGFRSADVKTALTTQFKEMDITIAVDVVVEAAPIMTPAPDGQAKPVPAPAAETKMPDMVVDVKPAGVEQPSEAVVPGTTTAVKKEKKKKAKKAKSVPLETPSPATAATVTSAAPLTFGSGVSGRRPTVVPVELKANDGDWDNIATEDELAEWGDMPPADLDDTPEQVVTISPAPESLKPITAKELKRLSWTVQNGILCNRDSAIINVGGRPAIVPREGAEELPKWTLFTDGRLRSLCGSK